MGVVGLDEWMVRHSQEFEVPLIPCGFIYEDACNYVHVRRKRPTRCQENEQRHTMLQKLTPARQALHLYENHPLVARWETSDYRLVELEILWHLVLGRQPFAVAAAEVEAQGAATIYAERGRGVQNEG